MNEANCHAPLRSTLFVLPGLCAAVILVGLWPRSAVGQAPEPELPSATLAESAGYFPTLVESELLKGASDSRSHGQSMGYDLENGPDSRRQIATDLFPYTDPTPNFYQRHSNVFAPMDRVLGVFTPNNAVAIESERLQNMSVTLDARLGILTRQFSPELAMVKAGPLFLDFLWVGAGVIVSDYDGPSTLNPDNDDGATGYIDLSARMFLRLTDTIYVSAAASLIYLPFENELALRFGNGNTDALFARFNYSDMLGPWDVTVYDEFKGRAGLQFYGDADRPAIDRAGRYYFGFQHDRANEFFNEDFTFFANRLGMEATRLVLDNEWRLAIAVDHTDFWQSFSFKNHANREHAGVWLGYEGSLLPFAPRFLYDVYSYDGFDSMLHRFMAQFTGRITENIDWYGQFGYLTSSGTQAEVDTFLWQIGIEHTLSQHTMHYLRFGEDFFVNEYMPETLTTRFVQYGVDHRFNRSLSLTAFIQFSEGETINPGLRLRDRMGAGVVLSWRPLDFTYIRAMMMYDQIDQAAPINTGDRWLYKLEVTQQLGMRLTGQAFYQYEQNDIVRSFSEHVLGLSLRRYF